MIAWGADIGFRRVSISAFDGARFEIRTATIPGLDQLAQAETFIALFRATERIADELIEAFGSPDSIVVEKPAGAKVAQEMHYSFALVSAALEGLGHGVVGYMMPATWKSKALGNGAADKKAIKQWAVNRGYVAPPKLLYAGQAQDEADSLGIAVAAHRETAIEPLPGLD